MSIPPQRRKLPVNPSLEHLQKQAKRRAKESPTLQLTTAQHQLAQEYGCKNWAELTQIVSSMAERHDQPASQGKRYTPMPAAARAGTSQGDFSELNRLLRESDFTQHDLDQSLAHVLWYGSEATWPARKVAADLLFEHGADPDGQYGSGGYGPIVFGTGECVEPDGLEWLIEHGADVTFSPIETKYGCQCPLSYILGTYSRGKNDRKHRYVELLLKHHAFIPPDVTPHVLAIHRGDSAQLAALVDADAGLVSSTYLSMPYGNIRLRGAGLLHCAVEFGEIECVDVLLARGANPNLKAAVTGGVGGQTPLFHAIATNCDAHFHVLKHLIQSVGPQLDLSVRATFVRYGIPQTKPMTPLEFSQFAGETDDARWRSKVSEEQALLQSLL